MKRKAAEGQWDFVGSLALIGEMLGMRDASRYQAAFSLCRELMRGRLRKLWQPRAEEEIILGRTLSDDEMLLEDGVAAHTYAVAARPQGAHAIIKEVRDQKHEYQTMMSNYVQSIKTDPRWQSHPTYRCLQHWFAECKAPILAFLVDDLFPNPLSNTAAPNMGVTEQRLEMLTATRSVVWFYVTKLYEHLILGRRVEGGDWFDMCYYIDAVPDGYLVTEDRRLIETCRRMPQRRMGVLRLHSLAALLGEREIAKRLRGCQKAGQNGR
ncbi:MAG: hypothetical protein Q8Q12_18415 [bacterium]|nr:hypothetical protein [bacterium]